MELTKEEEALILQNRKAEEDKLPKLEGFLKEDLYVVDAFSYDVGTYFKLRTDSYSQSEMMEEIERFRKEAFRLALLAGTRFVCFLNKCKEEWYDDVNYGIEGVDADWAKKYLRDIRHIKKGQK